MRIRRLTPLLVMCCLFASIFSLAQQRSTYEGTVVDAISQNPISMLVPFQFNLISFSIPSVAVS
jgi:hypothetical protein